MPSLADAIAANIRTKGPRCTIAVILPKLTKATLADLKAALAADEIPGTAIAQGLTDIGHPVSVSILLRHRRGQCGCPR